MRFYQFHKDGIAGVVEALDLHHQAFAGIARGNANGVEQLHLFKHGQHGLGGNIGHFGHFFNAGLQIPGRRKVADNDLANALLLFCQRRKTQLPQQVAIKGGLGRIAGLEGRNFFGKFKFARLRTAGRTGKLTEIILPVSILCQFLVVHLFLGGLTAFVVLLDRRGIFVYRRFFKKRVFKQLLLDSFQKFHARKLQQLDCLLQLRGHYQLLCQLQLLP